MTALPVLLYHHVSDGREVSVAGFEGQLKFLRENGYATATLSGLADHLRGVKKLPEKTVVITFDDGYADNWICAYPLLKKYGFSAIVFVVTQRIDKAPKGVRKTIAQGAASPDTLTDERGPAGFLSWEELWEMVGSGVFEVGSHTCTHKDFDRNAEYGDISAELEESSSVIEKRLGVKPVSIAWPWGDCADEWSAQLNQNGYVLAFSTKVGANIPGTDLLEIRRFKIQKDDVKWLSSRLFVYSSPVLARIYSAVYGADRNIKNAFLRFLRGK
jgi:peptidoglycan/xylan/chitin deacetylase (PgdA/CDA1 family)